MIGIPLPLCSCGVIPTAISLRKDGASRGATVAFMISTPQIGVDSIIATYSMMGLPFAIVRPNQVIYRIDGMSCNHCKNSVEKAIRGLENVENVEVVLGKKEAVVTGKPSDEDVKKAVEELGFDFKGRK
ncbi:MAG: cation transporter [Bacteroidales bacterium]|nr:cation transporter [Bacteroidales bacterium]